MPREIASFIVPVVNLVGPLLETGARLAETIWRDHRTETELIQVGLRAHPTGNAIHVARDDVDVVQGNHAVSIASRGAVPAELALEVLHMPWRSWRQYEHRVRIAGEAYLRSSMLIPSPNHHGMLDYERLTEHLLLPHFAARIPSTSEMASSPSFLLDDRLTKSGIFGLYESSDADHFDSEVAASLRSAGRTILGMGRQKRLLLDEIAANALQLKNSLALQADLEDALMQSQAEVTWLQSRRSIRLSETGTEWLRGGTRR
jgi:hypothetical protein